MPDPACPRPMPPLLQPDEPPAFEIVNGAGAAPVLFVCDHASARIPRCLDGLGVDERARSRHIAWDIGAAEVARRFAARFGAPAVLAGYSRLVVDLNRKLGDPTMIPALSEDTVIPGNRNLTPADKERRIEFLHRPYHRAVEESLAALRARGPGPAFVSVHSFTPVYKSVSRPWHVGVLWDRDGRIAIPLLERLRSRGDICVGDNEPYSGRDEHGFTVQHHAGRFALPGVSIETRQDLIADPAGVEKWARIVGDALAPILADPALFAPPKS